jgi:AcrR family transcriptional regulator
MLKRRKTTGVRKDQIVIAAKKLIIKKGSENVTVRAIAKEVGLSEGAIYRHFKSKRDILSLLVDYIEKDWVNELTLSTSHVDSSLSKLDNLFKAHISAIKQRQGLTFQVVAEIVSLGDKKLNQKISGTISRYMTSIQELLSTGVQTGELRKDLDLGGASLLFFGMIQGLVNVWALSNYDFDIVEKSLNLWQTFRESIINHYPR